MCGWRQTYHRPLRRLSLNDFFGSGLTFLTTRSDQPNLAHPEEPGRKGLAKSAKVANNKEE